MSIKTKMQSLIEAANAETGKGDTDLTTAVQSLISESGAAATFTPSVSADGTLSWTNNKGLTNPEPVNIKGPQGEDGGSVVIEGTASDDLSEVTITTPDAWTLVYEAWNSEKRPLVVLRLSDELYAYLTCVSSLDWTSQSQGVALFSLSAQKLLDSTPPYSIWLYESGEASILPVDIPSAVTDAHINSLIDAKLGVIENGSY